MATTVKKGNATKSRNRVPQRGKVKTTSPSHEAYKIDTQELLRKIDTSIRDALALDDITKTQISHDLHRHKRELEEHILKQETSVQNEKKHPHSHHKLQPTRNVPPELAGEIHIEEEVMEVSSSPNETDSVEITEKVSEKIILSGSGEEVSRTYTKEDIIVFDDKELTDADPEQTRKTSKKQAASNAASSDSKKKNKSELSHQLRDGKTPIVHADPLKNEAIKSTTNKFSKNHEAKKDEIRAAFDNPVNHSLEKILAADAETAFGGVSEIANTKENPFFKKNDDSILNKIKNNDYRPENDNFVAGVKSHLNKNFHVSKKDEIRAAFDNPIDKKTEHDKYDELNVAFKSDGQDKKIVTSQENDNLTDNEGREELVSGKPELENSSDNLIKNSEKVSLDSKKSKFEENEPRIADLFGNTITSSESKDNEDKKTDSKRKDNTLADEDISKKNLVSAESASAQKQIAPVENDVEQLPETKNQALANALDAKKVDQFINHETENNAENKSIKVGFKESDKMIGKGLPVNSFSEMDSKIWSAVHAELERQRSQIELIASENYVSEEIMAIAGSVLTNKYAEGYPKARYYGGCGNVDIIEQTAIERLKLLFKADHANVQPHSGSQANAAVYQALLKPGDTILGMSLKAGGHLTHGHKVNFSGQIYNSVQYGLDPKTELIDYKQVELLAKEHQPKLIIAGASSYSRIINFKRFGAIAKKVGAVLLVDMAHIAGLVAGGAHPNPFPHADVVTSTTHKTLRGPRGGIILCKSHFAKKIDHALFPGSQGGPLQHIIAGKAICFKEAESSEFKHYVHRVVRNASVFAKEFRKLGAKIVSGGTDNHLFTINVKDAWDITGHEAEVLLESVGITLNKNAIPNDKLPPQTTSGIRIGTAAMTTRGFGPVEFMQVAKIITDLCQNPHDVDAKNSARKNVRDLLKNFPLYTNRSY